MSNDAMTDVKIGVIEQRLASLENQLGRMATSMETLAEDMHRIATFEFRVGALERFTEKLDTSIRRLGERIESLERANIGHGLKISGGERIFWIVVTVVLSLIVNHLAK